MKLNTTKLLLISSIMIGVTILFATFWEALGFGVEETPILAFSMMISYGFNVAGLIFALTEIKTDMKKARFGLIGHLTLIIGFFALSGYALMTMN